MWGRILNRILSTGCTYKLNAGILQSAKRKNLPPAGCKPVSLSRMRPQPTIYTPQFCRGFSLIELIIALGIFFVIAATAPAVYNTLHMSSQVNAAGTHLAQTLRIARERSVAGLNGSAHGVYITTAQQYTLYQGPSYLVGRVPAYDQVTTLDASLSLSPVLTDVNFTKGLGTAETRTLTLAHGAAGVKTITVNQFGKIEEN